MEMNNDARERFECLKAMNTLAKMVNDETFYYGYWIEIIPDCASDEELMEIAADDLDIFNEAVECFILCFRKYARESGLYVGQKVWPLKEVAR